MYRCKATASSHDNLVVLDLNLSLLIIYKVLTISNLSDLDMRIIFASIFNEWVSRSASCSTFLSLSGRRLLSLILSVILLEVEKVHVQSFDFNKQIFNLHSDSKQLLNRLLFLKSTLSGFPLLIIS